MELDPTALGLEIGSGAAVGALVGFAAKKTAKLVAVLVGIQLAVFKYLESREILTVDWERLTGGLMEAKQVAESSTPPPWLDSILSTLSVSAAFTGGFLVGFKKG